MISRGDELEGHDGASVTLVGLYRRRLTPRWMLDTPRFLGFVELELEDGVRVKLEGQRPDEEVARLEGRRVVVRGVLGLPVEERDPFAGGFGVAETRHAAAAPLPPTLRATALPETVDA